MTFIEGAVTGPANESRVVEFLVDSGAAYSLLPEADWKAIGLTPRRKMTFTLADGTHIVRRISECLFNVAGEEAHSPVVLGEPGDNQALLGAATLETIGLVLDPFKRELRPMQARLA
mgnify:CR=1 FL=1